MDYKWSSFLIRTLVVSSLMLQPMTVVLAQSAQINLLKEQLTVMQSDSAQAQLYLKLGEVYTEHVLDSALYYIQKSINLAKNQADQRLLARAYLKLGYTYFRKSEFTRSLAALDQISRLEQMSQLQRRYPPDSTLLESQILTAMNYRSQGNYLKSLQQCLSILKDYEKNPDQYGREIGVLFTELGVIYDHQHQYKLALAYHKRRLEFSNKGANQRDLMHALLNMGAFYSNVGQLAKSHYYYRRALFFSRKFNLTHATTIILQSLGDIAYQRQNYDEAINYHNQGLLMTRRIGNLEHVGTSYLTLAKIYGALHEYDKALPYVDQAITTLRSVKAAYFLQKALETKSKLLEGSGNYRDALAITRESQALKDKLTGLDKHKAIVQVQAAYDLERKQKQIIELHKDLTIQEQAREKIQLQLTLAHQQRLLYLISLVLVTLLLISIHFSFRKLKKVQRLLLRQKAAITQQARQLAEINTTKDKLFSIISHDLRSPMARLKQDFYQLRMLPRITSSLEKPLNQLEDQVDRVLDLLTNLLDWSYSQLKGFQSHPQPIDLAEAMAETVSQLADHLRKKNILIINQIPAHTFIVVDKHQLNSILRNILGNAIKFTPINGYIRLHIAVNLSQIEVKIQDTGIGMSSEQLACLLTDPQIRPGTQGENSTGLGLRLCQELMARQSGTLQVTSQLQKGTTVKLTFPAADLNENEYSVSKSEIDALEPEKVS